MGSRAPNTPTLVCLHGLGRSLHDWNGVEAGLSRHGAVRAPALPRGGVNALMAATVDLPQHTTLIGHSMVGVVALRSAARAPDRMLGVLLTHSFFPPSRNGRGIAASVRHYGAHRIAVARELATRGSRPERSGSPTAAATTRTSSGHANGWPSPVGGSRELASRPRATVTGAN